MIQIADLRKNRRFPPPSQPLQETGHYRPFFKQQIAARSAEIERPIIRKQNANPKQNTSPNQLIAHTPCATKLHTTSLPRPMGGVGWWNEAWWMWGGGK
jgi:hypothetical protein